MRVKICGIQNEHDLDTAVRAGADAIGFMVGQVHQSTRFILPSTAARLGRRLPPYISPVIVTHLTDAESIMDILNHSSIYTVQLHGCSFQEMVKLHDAMPENGKIILAAYLDDEGNFPDIQEYYAYISAVMLDCYNLEPALIGLEEPRKEYRWTAAAAFTTACPLPVIIGGGLSPENIADAVAQIKPFGVDACAGIKTGPGEDEFCNSDKCRAFVRDARLAGFENPPAGACILERRQPLAPE
jgi:phosphoribosylanthranilate isomerase